MNHYTVTVLHLGETVQAYPQRRERDAHFDEVCKRIGMMVMADNIESVTIYRDGKVYREVTVKKQEKV